jgi:hypothetical protein
MPSRWRALPPSRWPGLVWKVDLADEGALRQAHDHEDAPGVDGDLACAAGTGQPSLGLRVVANDRRVQIAEAVDLRPAQQGHVDQAALQVEHEQVGHADDRGCAADQRGVADRQRQPRRLRAKNAALVDQLHVGGVAAASQIAGDVGQTDADEDGAVAAQRARGGDDHQFRGGGG